MNWINLQRRLKIGDGFAQKVVTGLADAARDETFHIFGVYL